MNKIERVLAVLEGRQPDRPPISFWHHFPLECAAGPAAVEAHVRHVERYDLDFLKIMDDNRYPRIGLPDEMVCQAADLECLTVFRGDEGTFGQQLELIGQLSKRYAGQMLMITTIFNAWTTLRLLMAPPAGKHGPPKLGGDVDPRDERMWQLLRQSPTALARALDTIATSLANFCVRCLAAGADGIFLSVRDDWVDTPENGLGNYDALVRPADLKILAGAERAVFNMLHVCGQAVNFSRFAEYPVHAVNWADRYAGPPLAAVATTMRPAICGGLDNLGTLTSGTPEDCQREVADAIRQVAPRPLIVAPGCTFDPDTVPAANLDAVRRAVEIGAGGI
jgi:uroporphyrinogen decarboxylase